MCPFTEGECATGGGTDVPSHVTFLLSSCLDLCEELNRFIMELVEVPLKREKKCWGFCSLMLLSLFPTLLLLCSDYMEVRSSCLLYAQQVECPVPKYRVKAFQTQVSE